LIFSVTQCTLIMWEVLTEFIWWKKYWII